MLCVVTSVRDYSLLATACRSLRLCMPREGSYYFHQNKVSGYVVRLPGLCYPVVFNLSTGLVTYHRLDNVHERYIHLMQLVYLCYSIQARIMRSGGRAPCNDICPESVRDAG
jgi:hypothetical protein